MKVSISGVFLGLICAGIGYFLLSGSWSAYTEYKRVQDYRGQAIGHVTNKHFKRGSDGGGNYYMDYWFMSSAGTKISATSSIGKQQWDVLRVDDTMEIRYDQSDPRRNICMSGDSPSIIFAFFMLLMGTVFIIFGCLRLAKSFRKFSPRVNKISKMPKKEN
ncbi:MAG: DUF3592 domain-containing protein [Syntrophaceae bacterium]|nr:DUF3592 domain-containing protein [Syntrophaceae bacterium]